MSLRYLGRTSGRLSGHAAFSQTTGPIPSPEQARMKQHRLWQVSRSFAPGPAAG